MTPEEIANAYHEESLQGEIRIATTKPNLKDYGATLFESRNGWRWTLEYSIQRELYWRDMAAWLGKQLELLK